MSKLCHGGKPDGEDFGLAVWQRYASPVWFDIQQTKVLNYRLAKGKQDDKHICPLQLGVIERAIDLWTNPGDMVFSPFAGIGSEVYQAVKQGRIGLGVELKRDYLNVACDNLERAERELLAETNDLFSLADNETEPLPMAGPT